MTCSNSNDLLDHLVGDGEQGLMVAECHQTAVGSSPGTWAQQAKDFAGVGNPTQGQKVRERREPACGHHAAGRSGLVLAFEVEL